MYFLAISLLINEGCAVTNQYESARSINSITSYENYLNKYPNSKYSSAARKELEILYEESDWNNIKSSNSVSKFQDFISQYPESKYKPQAEKSISTLEELQVWNKTKDLNTIYGYENYLSIYPNSKNAFDAKNMITTLKEEHAWEETKRTGTVVGYKRFASEFPYGLHYNEAIQKIKEIEVIIPDWQQASKTNSLKSYTQFLEKHPYSSYASLARDKINQIEHQEWSKTIQNNSVKGYQQYITSFPDSRYSEEAKKKIIDLEVDAIFAGDHGVLPPMSRTSSGSTYSTITEVEVYNNTSYTLTVRYSGPESKKITLAPKQKISITLKKGSYREAASVNAANVQNYAGIQNLDGGGYSEEFYIVTQRR